MNRSLGTFLSLSITLASLVSMPLAAVGAEPANNCHCFRNRTFNPADKFVSDDYILTTTFNSLLASEFNISKRQIIMMKMRDGIASADLMTALFIAKKTGTEVEQLLQMKKKQDWQKIVKALLDNATTPTIENDLSFIYTSGSDDKIADEISHRLITSRFSPSPDALKMLRKEKLNAKQLTLAFTLANHASVPVQNIADQYLSQGRSWSEIAHTLGLQPADTGKLLERVTPKK